MSDISSVNIAVSTTRHDIITLSTSATYLSRIVNSHIGNEQSVGTTPELLILGTVIASGIMCLFISNLDSVNFVTVDSVNSMDSFPQKILPGKHIFLMPETDTIYVKADTAQCKIWAAASY